MSNEAILNDYFKKLKENLLAKNYDQMLINLRLLGRLFENFNDKREKKTKDDYKISFDNNTNNTNESKKNYQKILNSLMFVLLTWDDSSDSIKKEDRQHVKYKGPLEKDDRRAIAVALNALFFHLTSKKQEKISEKQKPISELITLLSELITLLKNELSSEIPQLENSQIKNNIEEIGRAIQSFQTPNKKKKFVKYASILLALIAALACALSTGGAIILLFPFSSILAGIVVGGLVGLFGFIANFRFFSKNFPDFMISLLKEGGIIQFIDIHGNRKKLSGTYKYLLTPLAVLSSFSVGFGTSALTYYCIIGVFTKLLPIMAIIWPPLPILIAAVLATAVGITLSVAVLTASLEFLKKVAALNMDFRELRSYANSKCRKWFNNLKNLKTHEKVGLVIMLLLIPVGLAGLAYYRYAAAVDLSIVIGVAGSIVMGVVAYVAQIAFTCLSINKLKNALIKPFSSDTTEQAVEQQYSKSFSVLSNICCVVPLIVNAAGNAALVYDGSPTSIAGAISCGLNSFAGNIPQTDSLKASRDKLTEQICKNFFKNLSGSSQSQCSQENNSNLKMFT
jgi:hypothetical protein